MALVDPSAGERLRELREEHGFGSAEALAADLKIKSMGADWGARGVVDPWTIRQIERDGRVPGARIQFVLANYFGVDRRTIWIPGRQRERDAEIAR